MAQTTPHPLGIEIRKAEGSYLVDSNGKEILDFIAGIGVANLGHGHPNIVEAIKAQADKYLQVMVYGEMIQKPQLEFTRLLLNCLPDSLNMVYPVNSGTEANEAALKLAKRVTGRSKIIAFEGAYHGNTHGSLSVSFNEAKKAPFQPLLPQVEFIRLNQMEDLEIIDGETACVILETIQGDAGVRIPSSDYMVALRKRCTEKGALLILDEIQCGYGRTGKMFAFEHYNIVPDILTLGKALGGGLPVGAMVANRTKMLALSNNPPLGHITTFGGNPLIMAAAAAGLEIMRDESILDEVERKGALLETCLQHQCIVEIRRIGLMLAVELENETQVSSLVASCLENGLLLFWFLSNPHCFRIAPPLNIADADLKKGAAIIIEALNKLNA